MPSFSKILLISFLFLSNCSTKQKVTTATINISVKNFSGRVTVCDPGLRFDLSKNKVNLLQLDNKQKVSYTMNIDEPTFLILYFSSDKVFVYDLFISPGDDLNFACDFSKKDDRLAVTGIGSNNNQPEIFALSTMNNEKFRGDTTPYRVLAAINKQFETNKSILHDYVDKFKPSSSFIKMKLANLAYFVPVTYYEFNNNNNFGKPQEQRLTWQRVQDSILSATNFNNDYALKTYNYTHLLDLFLLRGVEGLWLNYQAGHHQINPNKEKVNDNYSQSGFLNVEFISKYLRGRTAEYGFGQVIKSEFRKADYKSVVYTYDFFKRKFPKSPFVSKFNNEIQKVIIKQQRLLGDKFIFFRNNGSDLNSFQQLISLKKGKTVFIDMWGTWCAPCREEIEKNSKPLYSYLKNKDVTLLYIANYDTDKENEWKKQIAFFDAQGEHILANSKLTEDIMAKVHSSSYPTYIIIKKDGSFKQTTAKYPVNLNSIIKEIDDAGKK